MQATVTMTTDVNNAPDRNLLRHRPRSRQRSEQPIGYASDLFNYLFIRYKNRTTGSEIRSCIDYLIPNGILYRLVHVCSFIRANAEMLVTLHTCLFRSLWIGKMIWRLLLRINLVAGPD